MVRRFLVCAAVIATAITLAPERSQAASKEIQELQRDIAQLQDQMRQLQQAEEKNFTALTVLTQQAVDAANRANTAVAVIQSSLQQNVREQQEKVVTPVVGLSSRMDSMSNDFRQVSQAVSDLTSMVAQLKSQLNDINTAIKGLSAPPVAPPGSTAGPGGPPAAATVQVPPPTDLLAAADRDKQGGNLTMALQEYGDYLKYYGNTDQAADAQYWIANIHMSQGDYPTAADEFDMVLEKYGDSPRAKDAMYYKGVCLVKSGKRQQGYEEFKSLIAQYPRTDQATRACSQITSLGLHCPTAPATKGGSRKKRG